MSFRESYTSHGLLRPLPDEAHVISARNTRVTTAGALATIAVTVVTITFYLKMIGLERYGVLAIIRTVDEFEASRWWEWSEQELRANRDFLHIHRSGPAL